MQKLLMTNILATFDLNLSNVYLILKIKTLYHVHPVMTDDYGGYGLNLHIKFLE